MRDLPVLGEFDLVWALDDAVNHLLDFNELVSALRGMKQNLAASGLLLFDVNELLVYRTFYAETTAIERGGRRLIWRGLTSSNVAPASICESRFELETVTGKAIERPKPSTHRQRHFPEAEILAALDYADLECLAIYGHDLDGIPRRPLDVHRHTKAIYIARPSNGEN
jgi:hypothetical protein